MRTIAHEPTFSQRLDHGILHLTGGRMDRVFTSLTLKTIDEDQRVVEGWASTGAEDRQNDVLDPLGCEFDLERTPIPFLLDHDHLAAVGEIEAAEATSRGIRFRARIRKVAEAGEVKNLCDRAWSLLKNGLRKSLSVGFLPIEREPRNGGGWLYTRWSWLELSAVAVPANPECQVISVRRCGESNGSRVVKLTRKDKLHGKIMVGMERQARARKRLGIPSTVVQLGPVDLLLARSRAKRRPRRRADGVVRLRS